MAVQNHIGQDADRGAYFNVKAMVNSIKTENAFYQVILIQIIKKNYLISLGLSNWKLPKKVNCRK